MKPTSMYSAKTLSVCLTVSAMIFMSSCNRSAEDKAKHLPPVSEHEIEPATLVDTMCFRNEFTHTMDKNKKDIDELKLEINNGIVSGEYNYKPALKDARKGKIEGTIKDSIIHAKYMFMQEGIADTVSLKIVLKENQTSIIDEDKRPELGLPKTLNKINCE